jgi:hypothetical protein
LSPKIIAIQVTLARAAKPHHNFFAFPAWESRIHQPHPLSQNTQLPNYYPSHSPSPTSPSSGFSKKEPNYKDGRKRKQQQQQAMGIQKLDKLPQEAVPLTRHSDIKLVLDTPKGMLYFFFFLCF